MSQVITWLQTCFNAITEWLGNLGNGTIGVSLVAVIVSGVCISMLVRVLIGGLKMGGSPKK